MWLIQRHDGTSSILRRPWLLAGPRMEAERTREHENEKREIGQRSGLSLAASLSGHPQGQGRQGHTGSGRSA